MTRGPCHGHKSKLDICRRNLNRGAIKLFNAPWKIKAVKKPAALALSADKFLEAGLLSPPQVSIVH